MSKDTADDLHQVSAAKYGPWAVIAGASEGTGAEFARQLAAVGINLILVARRQEPLDRLADELRNQGGVKVRTLALDLSHVDAAQTMFAFAADVEVGMYVSNAGTDTAMGPFLSIPLEQSMAMINMNVRTVTAACHAFLPPMCKRGRGGLVLMSSVSALVGGQPGVAIYSATKAFDLSFAESLNAELRGQGVDVIGVGAPPMATPAALRALEQVGMSWAGLCDPAHVVRTVLSKLGQAPSHIFDFVGVDTESGAASAASRHARIRAVDAMVAKIFGADK